MDRWKGGSLSRNRLETIGMETASLSVSESVPSQDRSDTSSTLNSSTT